mgnify:CR=1 FL=1
MAEARIIPNVESPGPNGAGRWCVYCSGNGYPIGIGRVVEIYMDGKKAIVFYSDKREPVPLFMDRLKIFPTPQEAITEFSRMTKFSLERVERIFIETFPSEQKKDLAA